MLRYAAVDIGSNSTRMLAAEVTPGVPLKVLAAEREVTRLGASVFRDGRLSDQAIEDTARVLARMAETYRRSGRGGRSRRRHQRGARCVESGGLHRARLGRARHAGRNHYRPRRSAPDSSGRHEPVAAARQAGLDRRYRRRQRGNHLERRRPPDRRGFETARRRAASGNVSARRSARVARTASDGRVRRRKARARHRPHGPPMGSRDRDLGHRRGRGLRGKSRVALAPRSSRPPARFHRADPQTVSQAIGARSRRPPQSRRHRTEARRDHRGRHGHAAAHPGAVSRARRRITPRPECATGSSPTWPRAASAANWLA